MIVTSSMREKETSREYALRVIEENIISLQLAPGDKVSEIEIANQLNLSRTPVREAFIELSGIDIVEIRPQRGTFVSLIDLSLVEEARFLRMIFEKEIVKYLCKYKSVDVKMKIEEQLFKQKLCLDNNKRQEFYMMDNDFHKTLAVLSNRERSYKFIQNIQVHFDRIRRLNLGATRCNEILGEHQAVADAIISGNSEVGEKLIEKHLLSYKDDIERLMNDNPEYIK